MAFRALMPLHKQPSTFTPQHGFALLSVLMLVAIISLMSLSLAKLVLTNTQATSVEHQRVKAEQLMAGGLRFAALSLASPRANVVASAIPSRHLTYSSPEANIGITIDNEAGFIGLLSADKALLEAALLAHGATRKEVPSLLNLLATLRPAEQTKNRQPRYRRLRETLDLTSLRYSELLAVTTLHNNHKGIHPSLASKEVLALVPMLSKAERNRVLSQRHNAQPRLIHTPVKNKHFISRISPYYRIKCSVVLYEQTYTQTFIIKMTNQTGRLFEIQARL